MQQIEKISLDEMDRKSGFFEKVRGVLGSAVGNWKEFKDLTKKKASKKMTLINDDHVLRNYIWKINNLCWAIAFTLQALVFFGLAMYYEASFTKFGYILVCIIAYMAANKFIGFWIDRAAWRRYTLDGLMVLGVIAVLFSDSAVQLFNIGTFMFFFWGYQFWRKYFEFKKLYKIALQAEEIRNAKQNL